MSSILVKIGALTLVSGLSVPAFAADPGDLLVDDQEIAVQDEVQSYQLAFDDDSNNNASNENATDADQSRAARVKEICAKVEATDEQKKQIMDQAFEYKIAAAPLVATIKVAKLKYLQNALASEGTNQIATSSAGEAITAVGQLLQAKEKMITSILFDTLKQEQRADALKCMKAMQKAKHHHRRH